MADRVGIIRDGELVAVENPQTLTSRTFRHVRVQFAEADQMLPTYRALQAMPGIDALRMEGTGLLFDAHGDMNPVVRLVAGTEIAGIDIERPSLEQAAAALASASRSVDDADVAKSNTVAVRGKAPTTARWFWAAAGLAAAAAILWVMTAVLWHGPRSDAPLFAARPLADIYRDWNEWEQAGRQLSDTIDAFARLQGSIARGPEQLLAALQMMDTAGQLAYKVYHFVGLKYDEDQRNNDVNARRQQVHALLARWSEATSWFNPELLKIPLDTIREWMTRDPALAVYRFALEEIFRLQEHTDRIEFRNIKLRPISK